MAEYDSATMKQRRYAAALLAPRGFTRAAIVSRGLKRYGMSSAEYEAQPTVGGWLASMTRRRLSQLIQQLTEERP